MTSQQGHRTASDGILHFLALFHIIPYLGFRRSRGFSSFYRSIHDRAYDIGRINNSKRRTFPEIGEHGYPECHRERGRDTRQFGKNAFTVEGAIGDVYIHTEDVHPLDYSTTLTVNIAASIPPMML
jgi:hypothetical protein